MTQHAATVESCAHTDPQSLLVAIGAVLRTMQEFARDVDASVTSTRKEYQQITVLLTRTLAQLLGSNAVAALSLQSLEHGLEAVTHLDDIRTVKHQLEDCLKAVQAESRRQEKQNAELRHVAASVAGHPLVAERCAECGEDPVTGLGLAPNALAAIREAREAGHDVMVVALRLDSLPFIVKRYGHETGDQFLLTASQLLAQGLKPVDRLFRWTGPCLVAILRGRRSLEAARAETDRLIFRTREHSIRFDGRAVMFKIVVSTLCLRALQCPDDNAIAGQIDAFVNQERWG
jgi:GGDEF domain-containing protein